MYNIFEAFRIFEGLGEIDAYPSELDLRISLCSLFRSSIYTILSFFLRYRALLSRTDLDSSCEGQS